MAPAVSSGAGSLLSDHNEAHWDLNYELYLPFSLALKFRLAVARNWGLWGRCIFDFRKNGVSHISTEDIIA